jgi:hypothetical protein
MKVKNYRYVTNRRGPRLAKNRAALALGVQLMRIMDG